ncbi:GRAM domain-containing protein 2B-like [Denticeps clupeoides]|uniref:GRAM domain-containing protein n=1 Tax=Denticeps clupeoides TaxID=299321 RepID=A0AAY4APV7_9TELE|nr:GRAM domain-containing protein 2B [Denticeps clupeoides]
MVLMVEQPDRLPTPLAAPDAAKPAKAERRGDARSVRANPETENGEDRQRPAGKTAVDPQLSVDAEFDLSEIRKRPSLMRFKPLEQPSPLQSPSDNETKLERKKSQFSQLSKANTQYHKIFKDISKDEVLKQSYTCAWQRDILYQGKMFISDNWICFHSKVFGKDTKIAIPVIAVTLIKKTKTAILVPNALVITTTSDRYVFVSFLSRDTTYKFLRSICLHLDADITGSSPITSSAENSFRADCSSSLPLDLSADFSDLDGVVRHRRHDMQESSSSGSQTPDYEKMSEFQSLPENFLDAVKNGEVAVQADIHLQTANSRHGTQPNGPSKSLLGDGHQDKQQHPVSLNTLLLIYLFLVCVLLLSSCYMAFKIVALEQRLNSLGSMGDYQHNENAIHRESDASAEIYGELSTNLFKLEKIQRNLRKLLEET